MAGLIGLTAADIDVQDALGAVRWAYEGEWIPHPVVRLTTTLPIAVQPDERVVVRARWGFPVGAGRPVGNSRDDKLLESRLWGSMFAKQGGHCLVPCTGVYEMIKDGDEKTSYWFRRRDGRPIVMPGLCRERNIKGAPALCCSIVTTEPNAFFQRFHRRQVCELPDAAAMDTWMTSTDVDELLPLLGPPAPEDWEAVPVPNRIFAPGRVEMDDLVEAGPPVRYEA